MDSVRADRQGVTAVGQRPAEELRPGEGEHGHRLAAEQRDADLRIHQAAVLPAQLDGAGVEGRGTAEGNGEAVDHRALGGAVVENNTLHLSGRSRQGVIDPLVQSPHPEGAVLRRAGPQLIHLGAVRVHFDGAGGRPERLRAVCSQREGIVPVRQPFRGP